jgi:hypothetical protein
MKTIVGLFDDMAQAKQAALDLESAGIPHHDISFVANNEGGRHVPTDAAGRTVARTTVTGHAIEHDTLVGAEVGGVAGLILGLTGLAIPGLGWIAGAGWLMGLLLGAGTGAVIGSLVGALTHVGVPAGDAEHYTEGVRRGGTLVAVKAEDRRAREVAEILGADGAVDIDERATLYQQEGFVPAATATTAAMASGLTAGSLADEGVAAHSGVRVYHHEAGTTGMAVGEPVLPGNRVPGIQTGGRDADGTPDTRGISEKVADAVTGDNVDDKTGKRVR